MTDGQVRGRLYEAQVRFAAGEIVSLQCLEGRHVGCPEEPGAQQSDDFGAGPLDGFHCECWCHSEAS